MNAGTIRRGRGARVTDGRCRAPKTTLSRGMKFRRSGSTLFFPWRARGTERGRPRRGYRGVYDLKGSRDARPDA